jgi:hypothetical protein
MLKDSYARSIEPVQAFYSVGAADWGVLSPPSGVQPVMPVSVGANASASGYILTNSRFKVGWKVSYVRPSATADPSGIDIGAIQCIGPLYPGAGVTVTNSFGANPADTSFCVINGCLFSASAGTTGATGPAVWNFAANATTVDNTVTWTSRGQRGLVKVTWENASGSNGEPALQQLDLFQS